MKAIRGRETTCDGELQNTTPKHINPKKNYIVHSQNKGLLKIKDKIF